MKKTFYLMLGMGVILTSCSQDELDVTHGDGTAVVRVTLDDGIATRSTYDNDDVAITRCLLEVRDANGNRVGGLHEATGTGGTFAFTVRGLDPDAEYTYLFWADNGTAYNAADLTAVTVNDMFYRTALAYSGKENGKPGDVSAVTLTHAVAKVSVKTTGELFSGDKVAIALKGIYTKIDVLRGAVGGADTYTGENQSYTLGAQPGSEVETLYFPAPADGGVGDMTITYTSGETKIPVSKTVTNVPLRANYRTLVSGDIANIYASDVKATLTTGWNDNEEQTLGKITLDQQGTLTEAMVNDALRLGGGRIVVEGKISQTDINTLMACVSKATIKTYVNLSKAEIVDDDTEWGNSGEGCVNLEYISFPEGITEITDHAFMDCENLKTVELPSTLETIGEGAFAMTRLSGELVIPENVTSIGRSAFWSNTSTITSVVWNTDMALSNNLAAFINDEYDNLTTVTINGAVPLFDPAAFFTLCEAIESITFTNETLVPEFQDSGAKITPGTTIYVPASLLDEYKAAEGWSDHAAQIQAIK